MGREPWVPTAWVLTQSWVDRGGCLAESMSSWGWGYGRQVTEGKKSMYQGRSQPGLRNRDNSRCLKGRELHGGRFQARRPDQGRW